MGQASRHALIPTRGSLNLCCCCRCCCCCGGDDEPKRERGREKQWLGEEKQEEGDELEKQRGIDNGTTWGKWFFVIVLSG